MMQNFAEAWHCCLMHAVASAFECKAAAARMHVSTDCYAASCSVCCNLSCSAIHHPMLASFCIGVKLALLPAQGSCPAPASNPINNFSFN
ncbi:hypothetical protein COO60DRAFT_349645 [Scenedesmus sp. NREL 46B-D3]|nr:hypothetical protein COO60DRAFT_349645 [Scenedesmus sp. NREL 46B-D3]